MNLSNLAISPDQGPCEMHVALLSDVEEKMIVNFKKKHNYLCKKYFRIIKTPRLKNIHLPYINREYHLMLRDVNNAIYSSTNVDFKKELQEVSRVIEDTALEILKASLKK